MKLRLGSLEKEVKNLRADAQKTHSLQVRYPIRRSLNTVKNIKLEITELGQLTIAEM